MLVACRLENEGAQSACNAMADLRVGYVGPSTLRKPPSFPVSSTQQPARAEGSVDAARLTPAESATSANGGPRAVPSVPQCAPGSRTPGAHGCRLERTPVLFSATLWPLDAAVDEGSAHRSHAPMTRIPTMAQAATPLSTTSRSASTNDMVGRKFTCS